MSHFYLPAQPIFTNTLASNFVGQWDQMVQPTQEYRDDHAACSDTTVPPGPPGQDLNSIINNIEAHRRLSSIASVNHHEGVPLQMNMLTSAYTATDSAQESDGYHYGSVSSAASSNFSNFGNVEQNSSMANVYGGDVARFYPSGEHVWQQQQQQQNAQGQYTQQGQHAPPQQQAQLPPARADNRVPISRRHDSSTSNTGSSAVSRNNSHASPSDLDGRQTLPRPNQAPPAAMGPMSVGVTIPPRPKPGRKPIEPQHAQDRRRVQNRMAQRNFRDKRQLKLVEAQEENEKMKLERDAERAEMAREREALRQQLNLINERAETERLQSDARIAALQKQLDTLQQSLQQTKQEQQGRQQASHSIGGFRPVPTSQSYTQASVLTPPEDNYYETDYTNFGQNDRSSYSSRNATSNESDPMDTTMDDDPCGFCSDESNCVCLQAKLAKWKEAAAPPPSVVTLPGNCEACRLDPARAQACRDMASSTRMATRAPLSQAPRPNLTSSMPPPDYSCSAMVDKFNQFGERHATIGNLFGRGQLTAYPRQNGGYEFEEKEAAEVLSTLSRRSTMVESPRDDSDSPSG